MTALLILFGIILIGCIIRYATRPKVVYHYHEFRVSGKAEKYTYNEKTGTVTFDKPIEQEYWDGPTPTKAQEEQNLQRIFKIIEQHPNGILAERNPEYVEEYLKRIDLDLPDNITTEKE